MDWKRFDRARQSATPMELELIEAYAQKRVSRRNFVKTGTMIGLSMPFMGAVIAACGGDDDDAGAPAATTGSDGTEAPDATTAPEPTAAPAAGGSITAGIQTGDANSGLDPLNMLDLGTYCVLSQSFEYLVGLSADGGIGPTALATGWSANDDASVWTFNLREGVTWQDGTPFTSADVAATIDRLIGQGVLTVASEGSTETPDDLTVVMNLDNPSGNLPALVSPYQAQSLITPADYTDGTTLDERSAGTGAYMLDSFDPTTFTAKFVPNPGWWGGTPTLDEITLQGFDSGGTKIAAMASGEVDVIQDLSVAEGGTLLSDPNFVALRPPSANHRKIWMNTQLPEGGPFTDPRVRQAVAYAINREQIVSTVYQGEAIIGNDHVVHPSFPSFDPSQPQRERNVEMAKQLMSDAGYEDGFETTFDVGDIGEVPQIAAIVEQNLAEIGITAPVRITPNSDFYGEYWCAGAEWGSQPDTGSPTRPCGASSEIGIVDYGHRPVPDVYFSRALATGGDWNGANYNNPAFDALFTEFQATADADARRAVTGQMQRMLSEDMPNLVHSFFQFLSGHNSSVQGVQATALGHLYFQNATKA